MLKGNASGMSYAGWMFGLNTESTYDGSSQPVSFGAGIRYWRKLQRRFEGFGFRLSTPPPFP